MARPDPQLGPGETLDRLSGAWWILQLERGHRFNTDDVLTAWTGLEAAPRARTVLDLGAGVGSIGLMVLQELGDEARLVSLEVQRVSVELDALRGQPLAGTVVALATTPERSATGATIYRARVRLDAPAAAGRPGQFRLDGRR